MLAGKLRHYVNIETPTRTKSGSGSVTIAWTLFKRVWAGIETLKGYEKQTAEAAWPGSDSKVSIRYISGVLPTMRIVYNDQIYSVLGINDIDQRHRSIELTCQSGVKAA